MGMPPSDAYSGPAEFEQLGLVRPWIDFLGLLLSDGTEAMQRALSCRVSCCIIRQSGKDKPHDGVLSYL